MARPILALNCGSSSLKFGLYDVDLASARLIVEGEAEEIGSRYSHFWLRKADDKNKPAVLPLSLKDHAAAFQHGLQLLKEFPAPQGVGHRFVHGGPNLTTHRMLDSTVQAELDSAIEFAPLHMPSALSVLRAAAESMPGVPQAICFDTAFHRTMPQVSCTYALPAEVRKLGVRRYGFHGLSLESILNQLKPVPERLIVAHLGNGSSITAILEGKSIDTTMGLTPTGGVMMGTRCGDLDPGISVYLLRHGYDSAERLEDLFDHQCGLRGISGGTSDVRELLRQRPTNTDSDLALSMFCYQVRKAIASLAGALEGVDLLVFTGGIGEHADGLRDEIVAGLKFLGPGLKMITLPAKEDEQIASNTSDLLEHRTLVHGS